MRVMMISARKAYDDAAKRHDELVEHHIDLITEIEENNDKIREAHKNAVAERASLNDEMVKAVDRMHEEALQAHQEHVEWWEYHQAEKQRLGRLEKVVAPFRYMLQGGDNSRMMGVPGDPPEKPEVEQLPEVPDPVFIDTPEVPEFRHPKPEVYRAKKVNGEDYVEIDGVHGKAIASPGSYILTAESDGHQIIVHPDDFTRFYEKVV